jgi:hypothetical protein
VALTPLSSFSHNGRPAPGGVELVSGEKTVRFATGMDEVYLEDGSHEPIDDLTGTLAAFERNNRITVNDSGAADRAGAEVAYVDATVPFFSNEEGGAAIFSVESAPIVLRDPQYQPGDDVGARRWDGGRNRLGARGV